MQCELHPPRLRVSLLMEEYHSEGQSQPEQNDFVHPQRGACALTYAFQRLCLEWNLDALLVPPPLQSAHL